jgi:hypothetical protein
MTVARASVSRASLACIRVAEGGALKSASAVVMEDESVPFCSSRLRATNLCIL